MGMFDIGEMDGWMDGWEMMGVSLCLWQIIMSVMYIEMIGDNPAMYCIEHTQS
jgi:hypothetical protein